MFGTHKIVHVVAQLKAFQSVTRAQTVQQERTLRQVHQPARYVQQNLGHKSSEVRQLTIVLVTLAIPGPTGHARRVWPDNTKVELELQCVRIVPPIQFRPAEAP